MDLGIKYLFQWACVKKNKNMEFISLSSKPLCMWSQPGPNLKRCSSKLVCKLPKTLICHQPSPVLSQPSMTSTTSYNRFEAVPSVSCVRKWENLTSDIRYFVSLLLFILFILLIASLGFSPYLFFVALFTLLSHFWTSSHVIYIPMRIYSFIFNLLC